MLRPCHCFIQHASLQCLPMVRATSNLSGLRQATSYHRNDLRWWHHTSLRSCPQHCIRPAMEACCTTDLAWLLVVWHYRPFATRLLLFGWTQMSLARLMTLLWSLRCSTRHLGINKAVARNGRFKVPMHLALPAEI